MSLSASDLDRIFKNNCTEIYNLFYEGKSITKFEGKLSMANTVRDCSISVVTHGRYLSEYRVLILDQKVNHSGWTEVVPDWCKSSLGRDTRTVHVLDLGAAARFCIQKADEFIKEISAATSFNPYEVTNTTNNGVHPYRSLPQGSKLL